jgi:hypothetical protein
LFGEKLKQILWFWRGKEGTMNIIIHLEATKQSFEKALPKKIYRRYGKKMYCISM